MKATAEDKRLLAWINLPADQRYETSIRARGVVLFRVWKWADRVGATEEEVFRVKDSLGLCSTAVEQTARELAASNL